MYLASCQFLDCYVNRPSWVSVTYGPHVNPPPLPLPIICWPSKRPRLGSGDVTGRALYCYIILNKASCMNMLNCIIFTIVDTINTPSKSSMCSACDVTSGNIQGSLRWKKKTISILRQVIHTSGAICLIFVQIMNDKSFFFCKRMLSLCHFSR